MSATSGAKGARVRPARTSRRWSALGVILIFAGWEFAARLMGPMLMATPLEALRAIGVLAGDPGFWTHSLDSLARIAMGVGAGCGIGFTLGVLAGHDARLRGLLEPLRWLLMAIPPVVVVVLAMLWFGLGSGMVIFITVLMMAPGMYVNTVKGMRMIDAGLLEMGRVYHFGTWARLRHIYLPALAAPLTAALLIAACGGAADRRLRWRAARGHGRGTGRRERRGLRAGQRAQHLRQRPALRLGAADPGSGGPAGIPAAATRPAPADPLAGAQPCLRCAT